MTFIANAISINSCYYDGKAYTVGAVIETVRGAKCKCVPETPDGLPMWVSDAWS